MYINVAMPLTSTVKLGQFIPLRIQILNASMYSLCLQSALCWVGAGGGEGHGLLYHIERPKIALMT